MLSDWGYDKDPESVFEAGRKEIADQFAHLRELEFYPHHGRALDFGCGVGRLSQALAATFDRVDGVDISESMIRSALEFNRHGDKCKYHVNTRDDLRLFDDDTFDFVYSNITLQHVPPEYALRYIAEFMRVLKPGGVAVFHVPGGKSYKPGSLGAKFYSFRRVWLRRLWKKLRGRPAVDMHHIGEDIVRETIDRNGGRLVDVTQQGSVRRKRYGMRYCVFMPGHREA